MNTLTTWLSIFLSLALGAQTPTDFTVSAVGGLNFAQLEGENIMDYAGANLGIMTRAQMTPKSALGIELLFSQNGEYILPAYYPIVEYGRIWLDHIEIPVHYNFVIFSDNAEYEDKPRFKRKLLEGQIGLAYARLLRAYAENINGEDISRQINYDRTETLLTQIGLTTELDKNWSLNGRASLPIAEGLGWTISARAIYTLRK